MTSNPRQEAQGLYKPKMVVIAGPNGSGKSTVTRKLRDHHAFPSLYINADEIAETLKRPFVEGDLKAMVVTIRQATGEMYRDNLINEDLIAGVTHQGRREHYAAVLAEAKRRQAMSAKQSFAFETVLSTPAKLALLDEARSWGFHIDLIFITTQDSRINIERVKNRVKKGGHPVDDAKIIERHVRSTALLPAALVRSDTAKIFNNSHDAPVLVAEKKTNAVSFPDPKRLPSMDSISYEHLCQWVDTYLYTPLSRRQTSYANIKALYGSQHVASANIRNGASASGIIVMIDEPYAVQKMTTYKSVSLGPSWLQRKRRQRVKQEIFITHDLSILPSSATPVLSDYMNQSVSVSIRYLYDITGKLIEPTCNLTP